jgi:hypothetical protein
MPLAAAPSGIAGASDKRQKNQEPKNQQELTREVRHQLVLLPYYSVFDNLAFRVDGDRVTLEGQVTRPTLKSDAESAVKSIAGISSVTNNIEVLPLSPMDLEPAHVPRGLAGTFALFRIRRAVDSHYREERQCDAGRCGGQRIG